MLNCCLGVKHFVEVFLFSVKFKCSRANCNLATLFFLEMKGFLTDLSLKIFDSFIRVTFESSHPPIFSIVGFPRSSRFRKCL